LHVHIESRNIIATSNQDCFHLEEILFGPLNLCPYKD
jgi:hypothetical protein